MSADIGEVALLLAKAQRVLFITGAGVSRDSGLPTYRGIGGLYNERKPEEGIPIEEILSGGMFKRDPALTWKYLFEIESACREAGFNRAHAVMQEIESARPHVCVLTQNVDGLHRKAGSKNVIEIHGELYDIQCPRCGLGYRVESFRELEIPPSCAACGATVRPNVVLFGELLPADKVAALHKELMGGFDMVFSVGTTSVFPYISGPVMEARKKGAPTVEINPGDTEVSQVVDFRLRLPAAEALDRLWQEARAEE